jgi:proteasome lid subunit RPN8/RPN11
VVSMRDEYKVRMSAEMAEKIRAHGTETYPEECCGAMLGRDARDEGEPREILEVLRLSNRREDSRRNRFTVTAKDVLGVEKEAEARGLEVIGWYHSHPDHAARPSEYDRENAWPWYSYVIVSVQGGAAKEMRSWRLQDDRERYAEEAIEIADAPAAG